MFRDDAHRLGPTLGRAAKLAKCAMDLRVAQYDVTPAQTHALLYLHHHGGTAWQSEVTQFMRVRPSSANGDLDRREEKGLVRRSVSGSDGRKRLITLTEKGEEQQALFQRCFLDTEEAMTRGLSPEETSTLLGLLDRIIQNMEEDRTT